MPFVRADQKAGIGRDPYEDKVDQIFCAAALVTLSVSSGVRMDLLNMAPHAPPCGIQRASGTFTALLPSLSASAYFR